MNGSLVLGIIISFILYNTSCRPHCPSTLNQIKLFDKIIHVHHWLLSLIGLLYFKTNDFIRGLLIGGVIHGIVMYDDWYVIIRDLKPTTDVRV
jgi:hypothetical protein